MKHSVKEIVLKNGLKGLVISAPDANVTSFEISFRAGEFLLAREKWETAHIMEHLMLGANSAFATAREFQAEIEKNGAYTNASTSAYDVNYEAECASFEAERVSALFVGSLQSPVFLEQEFTSEFGNVAEELVGRSNNHFRTLNIGLRASLGCYAVSDKERQQLMQNVTLADVKKHYKQTHSIKNARFVVAGGACEEVLKNFETLNLSGSIERIDMPPETPIILKKPVIIVKKDVPNYYFYVDSYAPHLLTEPERDALSVAATLLTETLHSKLLGTAREQGLVYSMGSGQQNLKLYTSFWLGAQVSKKNSVTLFELMQSTISYMKHNGVTAAELDAAKAYMKGRHARSAQTVTGLLSRYSHDYFQEGSIQHESTYDDRVQAVTNAGVMSALQNVFGTNMWALGILGNITKLEANILYNITSKLYE